MTVKLVLVVKQSMSDGPPTIEYRRSDTQRRVSCIECKNFTEEAKCSRELADCWPLGRVACSEWELRTEPHATKPCKSCGKAIPKYLTNQEFCDWACERVAEMRLGERPWWKS